MNTILHLVMAGLDPATQCAHVCARWRLVTPVEEFLAALPRGILGGRVRPGHDG